MSLKDALAKVIRARYDQCPPNKYPMEDSLAEFIIEHAAEVGLAVISLPPSEDIPEEYNDDPAVQCIGVWNVGDNSITAWSDGLISEGDGAEWSPEGIAPFATALLAAAEAVSA